MVSPNVHTITRPVPLPGSARWCASTGTAVPNSGVTAVRPISGAYRSSSGCATSATQAGSSSGRVVATTTSPAVPFPAPSSARRNATRWYAPATGRSSSSAWATAVPNVTSHSDGASARYASPRARLRRKPRWATARHRSPTVWYSVDQSTDSPSLRQAPA